MKNTNMQPKPIKSGAELFSYIPQRPPFVMVDKLLEKGENYVLSGLAIGEENLMVEQGVLSEGGLVENIAQTAALFAGISYAEQGLPVPLGYIAGIKDLEIVRLPQTGSSLQTKTTLTHDLMNIQVVAGEVYDEAQQLIARCELRIFIKAETDAQDS